MTEERVTNATAKKQMRPENHVEALIPQRVLLSLRSLFQPDEERSAARVEPAPPGTGTERPPPGDDLGEPIAVERTFAFVDVSGFTLYCDRNGERAAIALLTRFRSVVRDVAARRGVRVAKWLGDGVMLVDSAEGPIVATAVEIVARCSAVELETHAGIAVGTVLIFEGDDYVGRPVNLAARLCDAADAGEVLTVDLADPFPDWVEVKGSLQVKVTGVGRVAGVQSIGVMDELLEEFDPGVEEEAEV